MPHRVVRPRATRRIAALAAAVLVPGLALTVCGRTLSVARPAPLPAGLAAARPAWLPPARNAWLPLALVGAERTALSRPTAVPTEPPATVTPTPATTASATLAPTASAPPPAAFPTLDCPRPTDPSPSPTPEATPTGDPLGGDDQPPPAVLEVAGQSRRSGVGTYCWPVTRMCVDYWAVVTPREPIRVAGNLTGRLRLAPALAPDTLVMTVYPVTPDEDRSRPDSPYRYWEPTQPGSTYMLLHERDQAVRIARPPGLYVIEVFAAWKDLRADVDYGFLVEVTAQVARTATAGAGGRPAAGSPETSASQAGLRRLRQPAEAGLARNEPRASALIITHMSSVNAVVGRPPGE
jgi:hypothetical protein